MRDGEAQRVAGASDDQFRHVGMYYITYYIRLTRSVEDERCSEAHLHLVRKRWGFSRYTQDEPEVDLTVNEWVEVGLHLPKESRTDVPSGLSVGAGGLLGHDESGYLLDEFRSKCVPASVRDQGPFERGQVPQEAETLRRQGGVPVPVPLSAPTDQALEVGPLTSTLGERAEDPLGVERFPVVPQLGDREQTHERLVESLVTVAHRVIEVPLGGTLLDRA